MSSYLFLTFILLFGGAILTAATLDFLGPRAVERDVARADDEHAVISGALQLGMWWWFVPPGLDHRDRRRALRDERRARRGLQPEAAAHVSLVVDDLRVYYRTLRGDVKASTASASGRRRGDHGARGRVGLREDDAREEPHPARRPHEARGRHGLARGESLPIEDDRAMAKYRFRQVSIVPQYAMSASTRRGVGRLISDLLDARGAHYETMRPELVRRLSVVGLRGRTRPVPDRALGRDEAARRDGARRCSTPRS